MRILVTGLNGLIGSQVAFEILSDSFLSQHEYFSLTRTRATSSNALPSRILPSHVIYGDCSKRSDFLNAIIESKPDIIIHIAQLRFVPTLLSALDSVDLEPFLLLVGSTGIYSTFSTCSLPYAKSESLLAASKYSYCILRPSLIYGHQLDRNIHKLYEALKRSRPMLLPGGGVSTFQPVYYKDVAYGISHALRRYLSGSLPLCSIFNIVGPNTISLRDICMSIRTLQASRSLFFAIPVQPLYVLVSILYLMSFRRFFLRPEQILRMREDKVFSSDWSILDPMYTPTPIQTGLRFLHDQY
jgi:nucleoside-diphosphate-sugar epimerase